MVHFRSHKKEKDNLKRKVFTWVKDSRPEMSGVFPATTYIMPACNNHGHERFQFSESNHFKSWDLRNETKTSLFLIAAGECC